MSRRTTTKSIAATAALLTGLALSACGTTPGDRAVSGGLLGAGAGAAIGSLSGDAGTGALIGGAAGAATGALTDPCTLNLGDPWWRDHGGEDAYYARCGRP
jgi:osmotically inducible lipoprotein OsmB